MITVVPGRPTASHAALAVLLALAVALVAGGCLGDDGGGPPSDQPQPATEATEPRLGFNEDLIGPIHGATVEQKVQLIKDAGGTMLRTGLDWRSLEPARDRWDEAAWGAAEQLYETALAEGVQPIFIIGFAPDWARAPGSGCGPGSGPGLGVCELPPRPEMDLQWAEFAAETAKRFPRALIEVWNEPNLPSFWRAGPQPARYAQLFAVAERAIHATSPETQVLLGGLLGVGGPGRGRMLPGAFLARAYAARPAIAESADGISLHPYPDGTDLGPDSAFVEAFDQVLAARERLDLPEIPIYVTEVGLSTGGSMAVSPKQQAETALRLFERAAEMPSVRAVLFHRLLSPADTTDNRWELGSSWLLPGSFPPPPRPVYCEFVALAGNTYQGC